MKKIRKKLTADQIRRGVIFSSTLSKNTVEQTGDRVHEVFATDEDKNIVISRLLDDKFFNRSPWKYNIIRNMSGT